MRYIQYRNVGVMTDERNAYCREILCGIADYAYRDAHWAVQIGGNHPGDLERMENIQPDGLLVHAANRRVLEHLERSPIPVVCTSGARPPTGIPSVVSDDRAVGAMAAEHLLSRGFARFLILGPLSLHYFKERAAGFTDAVQGKAEICRTEANPLAHRLQQSSAEAALQMARLKEMLDRIEKPMAIFASDDIVGFRLLDALHQMEIRVPGSVAVLGVNDDEFRCTLSSPPLSSVRLAGEEVGRRGAALLQQMIDGGERPDGPVLLPPLDVRVRQSTSIYAVADEDVRAALNFIHDRALEPIDVEAILDAVPIARRTLEKRFKAVLGRTLMSHVNHVRIQRAKELLLDTDWSMLRIALHCGFRNSHRFSEVFRRLTGQTPSAFRNPGS